MAGNKFKVCTDETVESWKVISFPTLKTEPYNLADTYYYMTLGTCNYDTTML